MKMIQDAGIKLKSFFVECVRVVRVTKKPTMDTFKTTLKVSAMGIAIVGAVGFVISLIATLIGLV